MMGGTEVVVLRHGRDAIERLSVGQVRDLTSRATAATFYRDGLA